MNKRNAKKYNKRLSKNHKIIFKIDKIILKKIIAKLEDGPNIYFVIERINSPIIIDEYFYNKDKEIEIDTEYNIVNIYRADKLYIFTIESIEWYKENNLRIIELTIKDHSVYSIKEK